MASEDPAICERRTCSTGNKRRRVGQYKEDTDSSSSSSVNTSEHKKRKSNNVDEDFNNSSSSDNEKPDNCTTSKKQSPRRRSSSNEPKNDKDDNRSNSDDNNSNDDEDDKKQHPKHEQLTANDLFFDWNQAASATAGQWWGNDSLTRFVPIPELDSLVGWATHVDQPTRPADNVFGSSLNPLLGLPSESLPPSLLDVLHQNGASFQQQEQPRGLDVWGSLDSSAMVAIGMVLEEMVTLSLLPLAQRHVEQCRQQEASEKEESPADDDETTTRTKHANDQVFYDWTLPPEEALFKIIASESSLTEQPTHKKRGEQVLGSRDLEDCDDRNCASSASSASRVVV